MLDISLPPLLRLALLRACVATGCGIATAVESAAAWLAFIVEAPTQANAGARAALVLAHLERGGYSAVQPDPVVLTSLAAAAAWALHVDQPWVEPESEAERPAEPALPVPSDPAPAPSDA